MANKKRLIDADALLAELDKFVNPMPDANGLHFLSGLSTAITEIVDAPTVDAVEVIHGQWVDVCEIKSFKHTNIQVVECSKCEMRFCDIISNHHYMYRYCPYCGAKMDGGNEDV